MDFNFFEPFLLVEKSPQKKGDVSAIKYIAIAIGLALLVGILALTIPNLLQMNKLNRQVSELNQEMENPEFIEKINKIEQKTSELKAIKTDKAFLSALDIQMENRDKVNQAIIGFLADEVVEGLFFEEVMIKDNKVSVRGTGLSPMEIAQFEYDLRKNGNFEDITVENIAKRTDTEGYDFSMTIHTKDVINDEN